MFFFNHYFGIFSYMLPLFKLFFLHCGAIQLCISPFFFLSAFSGGNFRVYIQQVDSLPDMD